MRKKILSTIFVLIMIVSLFGCGSEEEISESVEVQKTEVEEEDENISSEPVTIRVANCGGATAASIAAVNVAYQKGFFEEIFDEEEVTIEISTFQNGPAVNEAFLAGEIDIVNGIGDQPTVNSFSAGKINTVVLATGAIFKNVGIIVNSDSEINSVEDLKGKKIGTMVGTSTHKILLQFLQDAGMTAEDVELINISDQNAELAALEKGEVDAVILLGAPYDSAITNGVAKTVTDGTKHPNYSYIEVAGSFLDEHKELVKKFLQAAKKGEEYINENPDESYQLLADMFDLTVEEVEALVAPVDYGIYLSEDSIQNLYDTGDFLYEQGLISNELSEEEIDKHISDIINSIE